MNSKIIVHCLIQNEENFIWYALNSVLPYVDKIMVWDTGSTDKTLKIVKSIKSPKISFKSFKNISLQGFSNLRQQMLDESSKKYDWLMILDGDEIWPNDSLSLTIKYLKTHPKIDSVVVRTRNLIGDIYHYLPESAGQYQFKNQKGHLALRFINLKRIPGLNVKHPYGQEGYFDQSGTPIQDRNPKKLAILDHYYFHATHLPRSSKDRETLKRAFKRKYELGEKNKTEDLPSIFFSPRPSMVPEVTSPAPVKFWIIAALLTPLRRLKRSLIKSSSGY